MKQPMTPRRRSQYSLCSIGRVCHRAMGNTPPAFTCSISPYFVSYDAEILEVMTCHRRSWRSHPSSLRLCPPRLSFSTVVFRALDERRTDAVAHLPARLHIAPEVNAR